MVTIHSSARVMFFPFCLWIGAAGYSLSSVSRVTPPSLSRSRSHAIYAEKEFWKPRFFAFATAFLNTSSGRLTVRRTVSPDFGLGSAGRAIGQLADQVLDEVTETREALFLLFINSSFPKLRGHGNGGSHGLFAVSFCFHFTPSMTGSDWMSILFFARCAWRANDSTHSRNFSVAISHTLSYLKHTHSHTI
jgi:hypothetical protein